MNEQLKIIISAEIDKLKTALQEGKKEVEGFTKDKEKFSAFNDEVQKVGDVSKKALATAGAAIVGAATALLALSKSTEEYRQNQAQLTAAFEQANMSANSAKGVYTELYKVIGEDDQAVESAANIAMLANSEKEAAQWAELASGVLGTFHDTLQPEAFYEAANETMKLGEATGAFTQMLEQTGVMSVDEFNAKLAACNTEAEKQALMLSVSNEAMGAAGDAYDKATEKIQKQREAQASLNDSMARIGEAVTPITTMLTEFAATLLEKLIPVIEEFVEEHGAQMAETLDKVATAIGNVLSWIIDNWELVSTIATIVLTVAAALTVFSTVMAIVNAVMAASPITWIVLAIVAAITALVAIIVLVIKHWDDIKAAGVKAWEGIKNAWDKVASWFNEKIIQPIINFFSGLWEKISTTFANVKEWFSEKFKAAWDGIKNVFSDSIIGKYFKTMWENIKQIFSVVKDVFTGNFKDAWEGIKKVFANWGSFFGGLWDTIKNKFSALGTKLGDAIGGAVKSGINKVIAWIEKTINGAINLINKAIGLINKLPGVNVGTIKPLSLPRLAKGGVVDDATTAIIGEAGKEAVVPLENNLEWLDKLAGMLNERMGGTLAPIVLQVDGKTFAEISVNSINNLTKQTGKLGLVMA